MLLAPAVASAQARTPRPEISAGRLVTFSGEASAAISEADDGFFNYSDYRYDITRLVRVDLAAAYRPGRRVAFVGDLRAQGAFGTTAWTVRPHALFARIRPWPDRAFDVQAGLIPPVFGAFGRRAYGSDNPLIGVPLAYQYLTSLRADALPGSADDLLRMRGRGWAVSYPVGNTAYDHGLPLVDGLRNQIGVEVHAGDRPIELSMAVTTGSLSTPQPSGGWSGTQVSARLAVHPTAGFSIGTSASRGVYLTLPNETVPAGRDTQRAMGLDVEYAGGYWILRAESVASWWSLPALPAGTFAATLRALSLDAEVRRRVGPGVYVAVRGGVLGFSGIDMTGTGYSTAWDAPVRRVEGGGGFALRRNVLLKASWQMNWRDGYARVREGLVSAQMIVAFR